MMQSSQNVAIVKFPFHSKVMAFSYCLFSWERGFAIGNSNSFARHDAIKMLNLIGASLSEPHTSKSFRAIVHGAKNMTKIG